MPERKYGGVIWTNHALQRASERGLTQSIALAAFNNPDSEENGRNPGSKQYKKQIGNSLVSIVAKKSERGEWLILSAWADPPIAGSSDANYQASKKDYNRASTLRKFWIILKRQLGF